MQVQAPGPGSGFQAQSPGTGPGPCFSLVSALLAHGTEHSSFTASAADGPQVLRGGATAAASQVIDVEGTVAAIPASGSARSAHGTETASVAMLQLRDMSSQTTSLTAVPIAGVIDGVAYEAAWTNGDGACGLHALFGDCNHGELVAPLCRAFVCEALPATIAEAFSLVTPSGRALSAEPCNNCGKMP